MKKRGKKRKKGEKGGEGGEDSILYRGREKRGPKKKESWNAFRDSQLYFSLYSVAGRGERCRCLFRGFKYAERKGRDREKKGEKRGKGAGKEGLRGGKGRRVLTIKGTSELKGKRERMAISAESH